MPTPRYTRTVRPCRRDHNDVDRFGDYAASTVGVIHHWLNNAGMVSSREPLMSIEPAEVVQVRVCVHACVRVCVCACVARHGDSYRKHE